jgi:hypothetical protein
MPQNRERIKLLEEHIASRKTWSSYVHLSTTLHRATAKRADDSLSDVRARLEQVLRQRR